MNRRFGNDPPQIKFLPTVLHKFRYNFSAAGTTSISPNSLFGAVNIASAAGTSWTPFHSVRLERIEMWGYGTHAAPDTISIIGADNDSLPDSTQTYTDTSRDASKPAHLVWTPSSTAHEYHSFAETGLWIFLTGQTNDVVDITMSFVFAQNGAQAIVSGSAGLVAGNIYYGNPDGPNGTGILKPITGTPWP